MKEDWDRRKIKEVADVIGGSTPKTNVEDYWGGDNYWVTPAELDGSKYIDKTVRCITTKAVEKTNLTLMPSGTVLLSSRAPIGKVCITKASMYCNQGFKNLVCKELLYNEFAYYFLKHNVDYLQSLGTGATFKEISKKVVENVVIPIPPLSEQQHIVEELDLLSSIIEKKKAQIKELDNLAQSLFYEMFGESSNWECKQLKEITTKMGSGATPRGGNQSYKEDGVSLIRSLNVHNGHFKYDDLAHIDEQQASQLDNVTIKENDVLLNITGASVARCCIVPTDILPARVNQHVSILRVKETLLNSTYLCHCLISPNSQAELLIMSKSNAATREALPKATLEKYLVPIPPLDLQNQFAEKVQAIEHQKELIKQSIKEVETLFNSRMDYYFN